MPSHPAPLGITGIRSWIVRISLLASMVMMERDSITSPPFPLPVVPNASQAEVATINGPNEVWLFATFLSRPFVKTAGRDDAASMPERTAEGWLLLDPLGPGIDQGVWGLCNL